MITVTKTERKKLEHVGLLQHKKYGIDAHDANFVITNRQSPGRAKHCYVSETFEILAFLEKYETLNLQKITSEQLKVLTQKGLVDDSKIQHSGEYKPIATVFIARNGDIRMKKIAANMIEIGIWKSTK